MKKIIRIGKEKNSRTINNKIIHSKSLLLFILTLGFLTLAHAQGGNLIDISGQVVDQENKQALAGVSVRLKAPLPEPLPMMPGISNSARNSNFRSP